VAVGKEMSSTEPGRLGKSQSLEPRAVRGISTYPGAETAVSRRQELGYTV